MLRSIFLSFILFHSSTLNASIALKQTSLALKFTYWYPSLTTTIQGNSIPIIFDLGGGGMMFGSGIVAKHPNAFSYTGKRKQVSDAVGRKVYLNQVLVKVISIGTRRYHNILAWVANDKDLISWGGGNTDPSEVILNGSVGTSFFKHHKQNILINYQNKAVTIFENFAIPKIDSFNDWNKVSFSAPYVTTKVQLNSNKYKFLWDTGAEFNYLDKSKTPPNRLKNCLLKEARAIGVELNQCHKLNEIIFMEDKMSKKNWKAHISLYTYELNSDGAFDGILGAPFFQAHQVFINFEKNTVSWK